MQVIKSEVRDSILESAKKEFSERGFSGSSVRTIAANARTSAGNLYKYYSGKEELFLALVLPVTDECIEMVGRFFDISNRGLKLTAEYMAHYVSDNLAIFKILTYGPSEHYAAFLSRFVECISRKIREYALSVAPGKVRALRNPSFFDAVAAGFVGGLRPILENFESTEVTAGYIGELLDFLFSDFVERLPAE